MELFNEVFSTFSFLFLVSVKISRDYTKRKAEEKWCREVGVTIPEWKALSLAMAKVRASEKRKLKRLRNPIHRLAENARSPNDSDTDTEGTMDVVWSDVSSQCKEKEKRPIPLAGIVFITASKLQRQPSDVSGKATDAGCSTVCEGRGHRRGHEPLNGVGGSLSFFFTTP